MFILVLAVMALLVALVLAFNRIEQIQRKLARLEAQIAQLRQAMAQRPAAEPESTPPPAASEFFAAQPAPEMTLEESAMAETPSWVPVPPAKRAQPQASPSRSRQEWESLVGGKLLNRIGALALVIGVGFFLKYAFDNNWISEPVRVLIGIAAGAGVLVLAARSHRKGFQVFAQGLAGAGISILYLAVYASFNYYHLVSQPVAFGGMLVVTAVAFWQGIRYDAMAIALLGWLGGFLTPYLLATEHDNPVGLFGYLTLVNIGVLAIVGQRPRWRIVSLLALIGTYVTYLLRYSSPWADSAFGSALTFLAVTWALFHYFDLYLAGKRDHDDVALGESAMNGSLWTVATLLLLDTSHHDWHVFIFGAATLLYGATAYWLGWVRKQTGRLVDLCEIFAVALLALTTYHLTDPFPRIALWALEGAAVVWLGLTLRRATIWRLGAALMGLAALLLLAHNDAIRYLEISEYQFLFNLRALAYLALAGSAMAGAYLFRRLAQGVEESGFAGVLNGGWFLVLFGFISVEVSDYFNQRMAAETARREHYGYFRLLTLMLFWTGYAVAMLYFALKRSSRVLVVCASIVLTVAAAFTLSVFNYRPVDEFVLVFNFRVLVFLMLAAGLFLASRWLPRAGLDSNAQTNMAALAQTMLVLLLLVLVTAEVWDAYQPAKLRLTHMGHGGPALSRLEDLQQLSLSGAWLLYSMILMGLGLWQRLPKVRLAAILLFFVTILKIFLYDLSFLDTLYRIFSFIGLGIILLAVSYAYQRYKSVIFEQKVKAA